MVKIISALPIVIATMNDHFEPMGNIDLSSSNTNPMTNAQYGDIVKDVLNEVSQQLQGFGVTSADDVKPTDEEFEELQDTCNSGVSFNTKSRVSCCIKTCIRKCDYRGTAKGNNQWKCWDTAPDSPAHLMTVVEQGSSFHDCSHACLCNTRFSGRPMNRESEYPLEVVPYTTYTEKQVNYTPTGPISFDQTVDICRAFGHSDAFRKQIEDLIQKDGKRLPLDLEALQTKVSAAVADQIDFTDVNHKLHVARRQVEVQLGVKSEGLYNCAGQLRMCGLMSNFERTVRSGDIGFGVFWAVKSENIRNDPFCVPELLAILAKECQL